MNLQFFVPPELAGQIVTVSYASDCESYIYRKTYDAGEQKEITYFTDLENLVGEFEPWNKEPEIDGEWLETHDSITARFSSMTDDEIEALIDGDTGFSSFLVSRILESAGKITIETDDDSPDRLNQDDDALFVVSAHRLKIGDRVVASWSRCSVGSYGANGNRPDTWDVSEDTNGGDVLPKRISEILRHLNLTDEIPDVPEPAKPSSIYKEDPNGEWCVYWSSAIREDERIVARYATEDEAEDVTEEHNRALKSANPGNLLCAYETRTFVDGEWQRPSHYMD